MKGNIRALQLRGMHIEPIRPTCVNTFISVNPRQDGASDFSLGHKMVAVRVIPVQKYVRISRIESRIHELENPAKAAGSSVSLHQPYKQPKRQAQMPTTFQVINSPRVASTADPWWDFLEPPIHRVKTLEATFSRNYPQPLKALHPQCLLPLCFRLELFLNPAHFRHDVLLPLPIEHHFRTSHALLAVVQFAGIALSGRRTKRYFSPVLYRLCPPCLLDYTLKKRSMRTAQEPSVTPRRPMPGITGTADT
ncbi:hypothetical protein FB451DRAFT_1171655 [Mycena latifolia]|nr:hypothetical protein FB451DRAFT_1171655 [Mycena latifolia]